MKVLSFLAVVIVIQLLQFIEAAPIENEEDLIWRLGTTVMPSHYELTIKTNISDQEKPSFSGNVQITLKSDKETDEIILHYQGLTIGENIHVTKKANSTEEIKGKSKYLNTKTDQWTIKFEDKLKEKTDYILYIDFKGYLSEDMKGFYKSEYKNSDGKKITIAATQFQTHHARRAFPCFDEPQFKATFKINIEHEKDLKAVSNQEGARSCSTGDRCTTKFNTTPKMSTYIVAFIVSDFAEETNEKKKLSVIAQPNYIKQMEFSLAESEKILDELDKITKTPYNSLGISKMHLAAIPDFSAGAMENWGLLTFRERALLKDNETTDMAEQKISLIIAHEQAHMWFGDHVTCDWWNHAWLNEGFATYFQYFATKEIHSDWHLHQQFVVDQMHTVFTMDAMKDTHPMSPKPQEINTPADMAKMFDSISYNKGASIIRMFRYVMGDDAFKKALKDYLIQNKIAQPHHLFEEFNRKWENNNIDRTKFFKSWTEQVGYPVVDVKVSDDGKKITLTQKRFLLDDDATEKDLTYIIPFTYTTSKKQSFLPPEPKEIIFFDSNHEITLENNDQLKDDDWIIGNVDQMGYFRVFYEDKILNNIKKALQTKDFGSISEINRAHLIDDLFNFARAGTNDLKYEKVFEILSYLENEKHYIPWTAAFNGLSYIESKLGHDVSELKERIKQSFKTVYDHLKFDNPIKNRLDSYNREKVLHWACKYDYSNCQDEANKKFEEYKNNKDKLIEKSIRSVVYCSTLRNAKNDENYKVLQQHFIDVNIPTEKVLTLNSLGCVKEKKHVEEHYKFIISDKVRKQDRVAALNALVSENPDSPQYVFDLFKGKEEFEKLKNALGSETEIAGIVSNIANRFTTEGQKKDIEKLIDHFQNPDTKETISKAASKVDKNKKWLEKYNESLRAGLRGGVGVKSISGLLITITTIMCLWLMY